MLSECWAAAAVSELDSASGRRPCSARTSLIRWTTACSIGSSRCVVPADATPVTSAKAAKPTARIEPLMHV